MPKKKIEVKVEEVKVDAPVEEFPQNGVVVTVHEDRFDSGTNRAEAEALPSLND